MSVDLERVVDLERFAENLNQVLARLSDVTSLDDLAENLLTAVIHLAPSSHAGFFFLDPVTSKLRLVRSRGYSKAEHTQAAKTAFRRHPMRVIRSGVMLHVPDTLADIHNSTQDPVTNVKLRSRLYIPVRSAGKVVGTLGLADLRPHAYSAQAVQALTIATNLAGIFYARLIAEEATRAKQRELRMIINGARLGTWHWHIASGEVNFNERWAGMLGYDLSEIGNHVTMWESLLHPDDAEEVFRALHEHLADESPSYATEHRLKTKTGAWKWVLDTGCVLERDADGNAIHMAGIHQDIDRRKAAQAQEEEFRDTLAVLVEERTRKLDGAVADLKNEVRRRGVVETRLRELQERLSRATESLVLAEETERRRLALQIHDGIGQDLTILRLRLRTEVMPAVDEPRIRAIIKEVDSSVVSIMKSARNLTQDLSPSILYELGLREAVANLLERTGQQHSLEVSLTWDPSLVLHAAQAPLLFGAIREFVHNAVKHAQATRLSISCRQLTKTIRLKVEDDGLGFAAGFSIDLPAAAGTGYGLYAWRDRLKTIGGTLKIQSRRKGGASVHIDLPLSASFAACAQMRT